MNQKIIIHILFLKLYKKIIEYAIELELSESRRNKNSEYYGYILSFSHNEDIFFNCLNHTFYNLMRKKEIILKTKLNDNHIYFPMLILSEIINKNFMTFDCKIYSPYLQYLEMNILLVEERKICCPLGIVIDKIYFLNLMLNEKPKFWFEHSGNSVKKQIPLNMIYDFEDSVIDKYTLTSGKYIRIEKDKIIELFENESEGRIRYDFSEDERPYIFMKKNSKFDHTKKNFTEYTLNDILNFIDEQISIYEIQDNKKLLNEEIEVESKNPKNLQRLLNYGVTIEEALEAIGFTDLR